MFKSGVFLFLIIGCLVPSIVYSYTFKSKRTDVNDEDGDGETFWQSDAGKEKSNEAKDGTESWTGRWLPSRLDDPTPPPKILHKIGVFKDHNIEATNENRVGMGIQPRKCDNGKMNLEVDWDRSPVNYTCYRDHIVPSYSIEPMIYCENIPSSYAAVHKCMDETIEYDDDIPMYGSHRPVWPVYGEYKFLPRQRWIHSLEHGAIVMLYHPCANPLEVKRLRNILTGCMRRYIITPYTLLDEDRPLALLSWGCRLTMSYVNPSVARQFIVEKALRGPEEISRDGAFDDYIIKRSEIVTDQKDTDLCPNI